MPSQSLNQSLYTTSSSIQTAVQTTSRPRHPHGHTDHQQATQQLSTPKGTVATTADPSTPMDTTVRQILQDGGQSSNIICILERNGFTTWRSIQTIKEGDTQTMGITPLGQQKLLMLCIKEDVQLHLPQSAVQQPQQPAGPRRGV